MTEILTESFCERCGTRYTFESPRARTRLKGVRVLSRGLKNFVLSDDSSMDEAMAAARNDTDREVTAHQLDAFHKTFNFCMSCRQYTCPNCWNEAEARCLTCAPHLGTEVLPAPFPDLSAPSFLVARTASTNGTNGSHDEAEAVNGFALAEAEAAAAVETDIGREADDDIDFAARLDSLTVSPAVVVPPFPSEVWEAEPSEPEVVAAEVEPEPVAAAEPVAARCRTRRRAGRRRGRTPSPNRSPPRPNPSPSRSPPRPNRRRAEPRPPPTGRSPNGRPSPTSPPPRSSPTR